MSCCGSCGGENKSKEIKEEKTSQANVQEEKKKSDTK